MNTQSSIPAHLPQYAAHTTPEKPWPLRVLSKKLQEYVMNLPHIWVEAEIITVNRRPGAGVYFFTIQDLESNVSISCKIFPHNFPAHIDSGMRVLLYVKPDFWLDRGNLTLHVFEIRQVGLGDILARLEQLKAQLASEGLFSPEQKKPLPFLPRKIGLICGRNTKAHDDVLVNARARWPEAQFEVREVQVQGTKAVSEILPALQELDALPEVEVIVLARGGGSVEDLLPFSDETLVRAVAATRTPVVSAIGHETDNPLLDFVADYRASTPTDAARKIVPDIKEERTQLTQLCQRGRKQLQNLVQTAQDNLTLLQNSPVFKHPESLLTPRNEELTNLRNWGRHLLNSKFNTQNIELSADLSRLRTLSPYSTLKRGYSILYSPAGTVIQQSSQVTTGSAVTALLASGKLTLEVVELSEPVVTPELNSQPATTPSEPDKEH